MPKDRRLYMTFPIDFHRHPKVMRLPVDVRWTFVEMVGEARLADNDGVFAAEDAEFLFPLDHLNALVASHPQRPLVLKRDETYVLREYAEHQQTKAERLARAEVSRENGAKGGRPKKNPNETQHKPSQVREKPSPNPEEPSGNHSQSQSQRTTTYVSESQSLDNRASDGTDALEISEWTGRLAAMAGLSLLPIVETVAKRTGIRLTSDQAYQVGSKILDKAKQAPKHPQPYVMRAIANNPAEIEQLIHKEIA